MPKQAGPRGFEMSVQPPARESAVPAAGSPTLTFASLVLSLSTSALLHLGLAPRGEGGGEGEEEEEAPTEANLPAAHQVIEILEMLREKTSGNLDADETRMLEQILHDLHLRFVEQKKG